MALPMAWQLLAGTTCEAQDDLLLTKDGAMRIGAREVIRTDDLSVVKSLSALFPAELSTEPGGSPVQARRREARVADQRIYAYEFCEPIDEETVVIQQGEVYSLNRSQHGILLLIGRMPHSGQLLEVRIPESRWRRSLNLYEVQWTKPLRGESCGDLFLVGCRLVFGPSRYWAL